MFMRILAAMAFAFRGALPVFQVPAGYPLGSSRRSGAATFKRAARKRRNQLKARRHVAR
ncbi:hypothetical protein [Chitinibacter sp. GC72]|uniref:hypothetical protein n=1 Tax=Chitinibacter sp. GC72 TaxID=1526917 RepID=UPI0012FC8062|nr:hypothetical protein [Chitinibacter sp. GC72]